MKIAFQLVVLMMFVTLIACGGKPQPKSVEPQPPKMRFAYLQNDSAKSVSVPEATPCQPDPNWRYVDLADGQETLVIAPGSVVCAAFPETLVTVHVVAMRLQNRGGDRPMGNPLPCGGILDLRGISDKVPVQIEAHCSRETP